MSALSVILEYNTLSRRYGMMALYTFYIQLHRTSHTQTEGTEKSDERGKNRGKIPVNTEGVNPYPPTPPPLEGGYTFFLKLCYGI